MYPSPKKLFHNLAGYNRKRVRQIVENTDRGSGAAALLLYPVPVV
jgi:hypothetical protein